MVLCCLALASVLAGCATGPDRIAVPAQLSGNASVPGLADVRVWGDSHFSEALLKERFAIGDKIVIDSNDDGLIFNGVAEAALA